MNTQSWSDESAGDPTDLVRIRNLGVDYGERHALDGVNLRVPAGEVFGLLGPNGAGKTTMFRVMSTLMEQSRGEVELCGIKLARTPREIRAVITYMPDLSPLPSDLRTAEYLRFFAGAHGLHGRSRETRVAECLEAVGLAERTKDICTQLSLGMRQRLALAKAMLHRPRLLILDEPASGLDPLARVDLRKVLRRVADTGATVILSSHVVAEIKDLCSSIGLLHRGRMLDAGPTRTVLTRFGGSRIRIVIHAPAKSREMAALLRQTPGVNPDLEILNEEAVEISLDESVMDRAALFTLLGQSRLGVSAMQTVETSVEDVLIQIANRPLDS